jgi:hypothetical protein
MIAPSELIAARPAAARRSRLGFVVLMRGAPVQFVGTPLFAACVYALGHMDNATRFESETAAWEAVREWRLPKDYCEVQVLP